MLQTVRAEKLDEKMRSFVQFPCFLLQLCPKCVFKLSKKVHFLQFCDDFSKKPKPVKTTCIYASKRSHYTLSENDMVYRGWNHHS